LETKFYTKKGRNELIKLEKPTKLLELVLYSAYIKGEPPVSVLLTALPEAGKTELVMRFAENKGCVVLSDCTAFGIMRDYGKKIKDGDIRHLIIPDLVKPLSRGKDTVHGLISFFNSLIEEGVLGISTYAETIIPKDSQTDKVKCGLIGTLARGILEDGRHQWGKMGFMSRLVPISYDYSTSTIMQIHSAIAKQEYHENTPIIVKLPDSDVEIILESQEADELVKLTTALVGLGQSGSSSNPEKVYGFRLQKQLQRLAMANALKNCRDRVVAEDVEQIIDLSAYINLNYNQI
jgi:hypothetical protein